jgi:hypothetical protein
MGAECAVTPPSCAPPTRFSHGLGQKETFPRGRVVLRKDLLLIHKQFSRLGLFKLVNLSQAELSLGSSALNEVDASVTKKRKSGQNPS